MFVLHDAPVDTIDIYLIVLAPRSSICYFPLIAGANSLVVWKFKSNNITTGYCNPYLESMRGMQNASFASTSEQPPTKHVLHRYILCIAKLCSSNVFICKTRTCETGTDELITSQTVLRCRDLNILCFLDYYCMFETYVINNPLEFKRS